MLFKNYEYFLAIAEHQSITKAAEKLYISQPSLSKYLSRLEKSLGIQLFDHSASPLKLSYAGEYYLSYVKEVTRMEKKLQRDFSEIQAYKRGKITLGIALWRASCIMPDVMPSFARMYPNIQIELKEGRGDYLESLLANDQVDFCIMNTPISYRNVFFEVILKEHIFLVMHKDNRLLTEFDRSTQLGRGYLKHFDITRLRELPQTLIMLKKGQHLTGTVQNLLNKYDLRFDSIFETENLTTAINLVSNGIGITFVPENGIINKPMENVAYFTVDSPPITGELAAVYKNNIPLGWAAKLFVEHIKQYYSSYEM